MPPPLNGERVAGSGGLSPDETELPLAWFAVNAQMGPAPDTVLVEFSYDTRGFTLAAPAVWDGAFIDAVDYVVVARQTSAAQATEPGWIDGYVLAMDTVALASIPLANVLNPNLHRSGSIVLPRSYFDQPGNGVWTLLVRARGCRSVAGVVGPSRVLSVSAVDAPVRMAVHIAPELLAALEAARGSKFNPD